jgi:hypothetical protein
MVSCSQPDHLSFILIKRKVVGIDDYVQRFLVVVLSADRFSYVMEQSGSLQPDSLGVTHVV